MSTTARLFIDAAPELGPEARRYMIDCLWFSPGPIDLTEPHRISIVLQRHEDECGRCRLDRLWERHGDPLMKAEVDRVYDEVQRRMVERHLAELMN
jgi:hypothetical protein